MSKEVGAGGRFDIFLGSDHSHRRKRLLDTRAEGVTVFEATPSRASENA